MKALSLFFSFHMAQKEDFWRCPSLLPLRNLKHFKHFKLWGETIVWFQGVCREQKFSVADLFAQVLQLKCSFYITLPSLCTLNLSNHHRPHSNGMTTCNLEESKLLLNLCYIKSPWPTSHWFAFIVLLQGMAFHIMQSLHTKMPARPRDAEKKSQFLKSIHYINTVSTL